jgi:hypothetical protein
MTLATGMLIMQRRSIPPLLRDGFRTPVEDLIHEDTSLTAPTDDSGQ